MCLAIFHMSLDLAHPIESVRLRHLHEKLNPLKYSPTFDEFHTMGYTHFWHFTTSPSKSVFAAFKEDVVELMPLLEKTCDAYTEDDLFVIAPTGKGDTFMFPYGASQIKLGVQHFCKTHGEIYDEGVMLVLYLAKHHFGDYITIKTDGTIMDLDIVSEAFPGEFDHVNTSFVIDQKELVIVEDM